MFDDATALTNSNATSRPTKPFDTADLLTSPILQVLHRPVQAFVERRLGFSGLNAIYQAAGGDTAEAGAFCRQALACLYSSWELDAEDLDRLRAIEGPLVVVANHPFGGIDSLCLMDLMDQLRPGAWKVFSNAFLGKVTPLNRHRIQVDSIGLSEDAGLLNRKALREALSFLKSGGCLALFPARRVAHFDV